MSNSITVNEINRFSKLRKGKNPPYRIMYGGKEVQYLAKGNEMVNDYVDRCSARWQKGYKKIVPSAIYSNNFNYLLFSQWQSPSTVSSDTFVWSYLYDYRHTIESTITTNDVTNKNIVTMMNGFTLGNNYPHLSIKYNSYYNKFKAMQHDKYCYSYREFYGITEDSSYPTALRDTRCLSGYSICKEFLNSVNAFSIELNFGLDNAASTITYTSQIDYTPLIMLKIYDSTWQTLVKNLSTYNKYCNGSSTNLNYTYQYKDFFFNPKNSYGTSLNPNDPYGKNKLYSYIQTDEAWAAVTNVHGKDLSGYAADFISQIFVKDSIYPHVNLILTCDKQTVSLYTNGELYASVDISQYLVNGNQLFDIDIMFDRDVTMDNNGNITSQTAKATPVGKLYSLQVYNECLTPAQVEKVFNVTEKYLCVENYWQLEPVEYPSEVQERAVPTLTYEAGPNTEFDVNSGYYILLWKYWNEARKAEYYCRYEPITKQIQWTFDDPTVFRTGGNTTAHASYAVRDFTWTRDYTITVTTPL